MLKQVLLLVVILVALGVYVTAESAQVSHQRLRVAPLKDFRNDVTEGTGAKDVFSS